MSKLKERNYQEEPLGLLEPSIYYLLDGGADLSQPISPLLHDRGEDNSIDVSGLSVLTPADPCEPPTHPSSTSPPPAPPGWACVAVRCCYCLFKFTQEPLKEPQGPLVRLPTLKTSEILKIHLVEAYAPALPATPGRSAGL